MKKVLIVVDRPGWALDFRLRPIADENENIDIGYVFIGGGRDIKSKYTDTKEARKIASYNFDDYDVVHFTMPKFAKVFQQLKPIKAKRILSLSNEVDNDRDLEKYIDEVVCPTKYLYERYKGKHKTHYLAHWVDTRLFNPEKAKTLNADQKRIKTVEVKLKPDYLKSIRVNSDGLYEVDYAKGKKLVDEGKATYFKQPDSKEKTVGFAGRVIKAKRYDLIQKAAYEAGIFFEACGYITDRPTFKRYARIVGDRYKYENIIPYKEMPEFFGILDLYCNLSVPQVECGPAPVLQAMACGIPVMSTRTGWALDHCTHKENIYFVEEKDIHNLSNIMKGFAKDKPLRKKIAANALKLVKKFDFDYYNKGLKKIYGYSS